MSTTTVITQNSGLDQKFIDNVAADVRGNLPKEQSEKLHTPEMALKRYAALLALKKGVESQLAAQKGRLAKTYAQYEKEGRLHEWPMFRGEQADWRGKAIYFMMTVEAHLIACKQQMAEHHNENLQAKYLLDAIRQHRQELLEEDIEITDADRHLHLAAGLIKTAS